MLERIAEELGKRDRLEPGEELALVFDDAIVVASMNEDRELNLRVVIGYEKVAGALGA